MACNTKSPQAQRDKASSPANRPTRVPISMLLSNEEQTAIGILPASRWQQQFPQEEPNDRFAARAKTASLTESIFQFREIHGRTYHSDIGNAQSWEPNDERHIDAMEIAHHTFTLVIGRRLYCAPLDKKRIQSVLDVGTGTGLWAIDFADEFPDVDVLGTDITPIQPNWVPANVRFELDDCNLEWTWPDNTFDFIHGRMLVGVIEDWYEFHRQAFRTCKPGGYVETFVGCTTFQCDDGTLKEGSAMSQWGKVFNEGGRQFGRTFEVYENDLQRKAMAAAGFEDIRYQDYFIPMGGWGSDKEAAERGLWWKIALEADLEGYINYIFNCLVGWTPEETKAYADQLRKEWSNPNIHGYFWARSAWGRKPEQFPEDTRTGR
ncbi:S-adenosyl-L-methionine-dependent methyltransferase [Pseudoneurospora amorphoporcata]|uniref:S-adenosyl-L-methionine-dependent methyltransferase n=1 Tax=Pseudoneurospora amorphoporcata TaxID=241081 RepID=A0AAN6NMH9_9PEZI|nr:S-adenosyl-L-methionine-dependent methyltransferase [Pseudoneurospora amorphoporcata]